MNCGEPTIFKFLMESSVLLGHPLHVGVI